MYAGTGVRDRMLGAPLRICHDLCDSGWYERCREGLPCHVGGHVSRVTARVMELCYVKICVSRTRSSRCLQSAQTLGIMISLSPGVGTVDTAVCCCSGHCSAVSPLELSTRQCLYYRAFVSASYVYFHRV